MTSISGIRRIIDRFELAGREVAMLQRDDDPFDMVRLAHTDEVDLELGRVVNLAGARPKLATALAVWTPGTRVDVLATVQQRWRHFELEVIG